MIKRGMHMVNNTLFREKLDMVRCNVEGGGVQVLIFLMVGLGSRDNQVKV